MVHTPEKRSWLSRSYIGRHWRGELSLPISYFVNGILVTLITSVIVFAVSAIFFGSYTPWSGLLALVGIWCFALLISLWQIVGTWRSANDHVGRGGRVFWAGAAKFMMIIAALQTAAAFAQSGWPQLKESFLIVAGDPSIGTFSLRLMNGGTEIEFAGGIPFGATVELAKLLDAAPQVQTVHLDSHGGRIVEAERLRDLIWERGLSTYVAGECLSACTIAYLGGRERYLHHNGRLGFHAASFPGISESDMRSQNRQIAYEAGVLGVEREFAEKAYLSPADSMWYPTPQELLDARFVTHIASGQFAISGFGRNPSSEAIATILKEIPLYTTLANVEPDVFGQMIEIFRNGAIEGQDEVQVLARTRSLVSDLIDKYAPHASNEALLALGGVLVEELEAIGTRDRLACYTFLFPEQGQFVDIKNYVSSEIQARELDATELIIVTGSFLDKYDISQDRIELLYEKIFSEIQAQYDSDILEGFLMMGADISSLEKDRVCEITYVLYKEILMLPPNDASDLLRDMFSQ